MLIAIKYVLNTVKLLFYMLIFTFYLISCNNRTEKLNIEKTTVTPKDTIVGDSIYKIGDFLFEGKKNAKFEFVKKGEKASIKTKGDTLYADSDIVLLGDINDLTGPGVFKKFKFKSEFNDFKTTEIYKGRLAKPNFSTDPDSKYLITRIKEGCKTNGVNFAGHYTIVQWGCGAACQQMAIVDRINGDIIYSKIPFDTVDGHCGVKYKIDSRMLIINTEALSESWGYEPGYKRYNFWRIPAIYEIKDGRLKQIE